MKVPHFILQSKLTRPFTARTLRRPRLEEQIKAITYKKLALIIAGAGYGKSTLVAQTLLNIDAHAIWYNLDQFDNDLVTFMGHLFTGFQQYDPGFGTDLWPKLAVPITSRESRRKLMITFLWEVERLSVKPLLIVLDDYHLIQSSSDVAEAIEFLMAHIPKTLHLIIVSRSEPGLKLSRYRAMMDIVELNEKDLSFTIDEIRELFRDLFNVPISPSEIGKLTSKTGGWAAALMLFFNALKGDSQKAAYVKRFEANQSKTFIFKYLEENIVERQPAHIQQFMMRSSLLSHLEPSVCNIICGVQNAHEILNGLCKNHLLTFPCNGEGNCYQYHLLLKNFLSDRLINQHGHEAVREGHRVIAKVMEKKHDIQRAVHHYFASEHYHEVVRVITSLAPVDLKYLPVTFLKRTFDQIPCRLMARNAQLLCLRAKIMSLSGEIKRAEGDFQTAIRLFHESKDVSGTANCHKEMGFHYYLTGNLVKAIQELEGVWAHPPDNALILAEVAGLLILFYSILGDLDAADAFCQSSMHRFTGPDTVDGTFVRAWFILFRAYRFHVEGRFQKADTLNQQALNTFLEMKLETFFPIMYFQTALTAYYQAEHVNGHDYAQAGIRIATRQGLHGYQYAWLLYARGLNRFGLGTHDQALVDIEESFDLFTAYNNTWGQALVQELRGMIYRYKRNWEKAIAAFQTGLAMINASELKKAPVAHALLLGLTEVHLDSGQPDHARRVFDGVFEDGLISRFDRFRYHLLQARLGNQTSILAKATDHFEKAITIARDNGYENWLTPQRQWMTTLLVACYDQGKCKDTIRQLFMGAGYETITALHLLKSSHPGQLGHAAKRLLSTLPHNVPAPLNIRCLGSFSVCIGERLIPKQNWRNAKAALIFKYLTVNKARGWTPKETLLELAWPDEDPVVTTPRFHVALNSLRKLLEPDLRRGVPSAYILKQNDGYHLEIGQDGRIDALDFIEADSQAIAAESSKSDLTLTLSLKAISLYRGSLLEEHPYDEWLAEDRELFKMRHLKALARIIRIYEKQEAWHPCIQYCEMYLIHDPLAEPFYRKLMLLHAKAGNRPRMIQTFEKCRTKLNDLLDCPVSNTTLELFEALKSNDQ